MFDAQAIGHVIAEILAARDLGVQVSVVVGGGNVFRGRDAEAWHLDRAEADNIGMLGTVINAVMLRAALNTRSDHDVRVMSAFPLASIVEPYIRLRADKHLTKGTIVLLSGGNGQPFVTTDYPSAQRAVELGCEAIFAAKEGVDGVFTTDPKIDASAKMYATLSYDDVLSNDIRVMDQAALLLARDHDVPIHVFGFDNQRAISRICNGENVGTLISSKVKTELSQGK